MRPGLRQRVITALVLAFALIAAAAFLPRLPLAMALGAVVAVAAWEWSTLMGLQRIILRALCPLAAIAGMAWLYGYCRLGGDPKLPEVQSILGLAATWWALALLWVMGYPGSGRIWGNRFMLGLVGLLVLLPPWLAVVYLLSYEAGRLLLLGMVITVAATDIGAYFAGKRFGRRKLAPQVSPAKSWEGFWGGFLACLAAALPAALLLPTPLAPLSLVAVVMCASLASSVGDLVESMVKRHRGVKDSGSLLPGHGGVLDRIDGITSAAPVFALGLILAGWLP